MIIDISSYNGKIDFKEMAAKENIERVILRGTTKDGELDTRYIENINGILKELPTCTAIDVYKFSYARNYADAACEAYNLIQKLKCSGTFKMIDRIWLDLEKWGDRDYTYKEAAEVIAAYATVCRQFFADFGIYCNYNYLTCIIPRWAQTFPIWLARWGSKMGNIEPFKVEIWQYTNSGQCAGIKGNVDISRLVK